MKTATRSIRRDIFSVKTEFDTGTTRRESHAFMSYSRAAAGRFLRDTRRQGNTARLVHPADWVVSEYVAAGNTLR